MITFIDTADIEPHGDVFLVTAMSGGEEIKLMLTFNSVGILAARCRQVLNERALERREAAGKVIVFRKEPEGRAKR